MSAVRVAAVELPVVVATREAASHDGTVVWVVRRCCYCRRRHTHLADPKLTEAVIPARFYRLTEVSPGC